MTVGFAPKVGRCGSTSSARWAGSCTTRSSTSSTSTTRSWKRGRNRHPAGRPARHGLMRLEKSYRMGHRPERRELDPAGGPEPVRAHEQGRVHRPRCLAGKRRRLSSATSPLKSTPMTRTASATSRSSWATVGTRHGGGFGHYVNKCCCWATWMPSGRGGRVPPHPRARRPAPGEDHLAQPLDPDNEHLRLFWPQEPPTPIRPGLRAKEAGLGWTGLDLRG